MKHLLLILLTILISVSAAAAERCEAQFNPNLPVARARIAGADAARILFYQRSLRRAGSAQALAMARYGDSIGKDALAKLRSLDPSFEVLVADPGVVLRIDDFVAFARSRSETEAWSMRESYRKHLGTERVYRALAMTPEMARLAARQGLLARYLRGDGGELRGGGADPYTHNVFTMMRERFQNANGDVVANSPTLSMIDGLLSVTSDLKIAKLVAGQIVKMVNSPDVKMYVYELELSVLNLLKRPGDDGKIESFVLMRIDRSEIVAVEGPLEAQMIDF